MLKLKGIFIVNQWNILITYTIGYIVEVANDGQEALDLFKEKGKEGKQFGFVLMDMMMPIMDGLTSSKLIREYEKEVSLYLFYILFIFEI